jgi:hypothetical protein
VDRHIHVHHIGENIWGGLPKKCQCDVVNDEDWVLIMKWWETSTIVSPNQKDVKRRIIVPKTFEWHATHYCKNHKYNSNHLPLFVIKFIRDESKNLIKTLWHLYLVTLCFDYVNGVGWLHDLDEHGI